MCPPTRDRAAIVQDRGVFIRDIQMTLAITSRANNVTAAMHINILDVMFSSF
jgi:hypothetical protein